MVVNLVKQVVRYLLCCFTVSFMGSFLQHWGDYFLILVQKHPNWPTVGLFALNALSFTLDMFGGAFYYAGFVVGIGGVCWMIFIHFYRKIF